MRVQRSIVSDLQRQIAELERGSWRPRTATVCSKYTLSLTSWRPRLGDLPLVLMSLLRQTVRPAGITVWLSHDDLARLDPQKRELFTAHGVQFSGCDDLCCHTKWLPAIEAGMADPFVICDDDILYPSDWFGRLVAEDRPDAFVGARAHLIRCEADGRPAPYSSWVHDVRHQSQPSQLLFITACGGAVVHPERIGKAFLDRKRIQAECPRADDIWLKAAHLAAGIPCYKTKYSFPCLELPGSFESGLLRTNVDTGGNDAQMGIVADLLKSDN